MKKLFAVILCLALLVSLSGCGSIYENYKEIEDLLVLQTMGLDKAAGGLRLSLASAAGSYESGAAVCLSADGSTVTEAVDAVRGGSFEKELFFSHINSVLIGERAARNGIESALSYICRSPELRIDLPVFIIKSGTACDAMENSGNTEQSIAEILASVRQKLEWRDGGAVTGAAEIIRSLKSRGCALVCALEYGPSSEKSCLPAGSSEGTEKTVSVCGYALIKDGRLCGYMNSEQAVGADFLMGNVRISDITVSDRSGEKASLQIDSGSSEILPVWSEDMLSGIDIKLCLNASVLEYSGSLSQNEYLLSALEKELSRRITGAIQLSVQHRADFFGLAQQLKQADPGRSSHIPQDFSQFLPELEIKISIRGKLSHTNDIKDTST